MTITVKVFTDFAKKPDFLHQNQLPERISVYARRRLGIDVPRQPFTYLNTHIYLEATYNGQGHRLG